MRIEWTAAAEGDLDELFQYIASDSELNAERFIDNVVESVGVLAAQPKIGKVVPEAGIESVREIIFRKRYRIFYEIRRSRIRILAIVHCRRYGLGLSPRPWEPR